jgi:hypothetical protein
MYVIRSLSMNSIIQKLDLISYKIIIDMLCRLSSTFKKVVI